jgi:hypothetical protein
LPVGRRITFERRQRRARGRLVQLVSAFGDIGRRAEPERDRKLPREPLSEGVDRHHAQATRIRHDVPTALCVALDDLARQRVRELLVRLRGRLGRARHLQRIDQPLPHFGSSLARERDRHHLLRSLHGGEQREHALDQQFRLAGTRRRTNNETGVHIERAPACRRVECEQAAIAHRAFLQSHR